MIKVSDYVTKFLIKNGINDIFMIVGGGVIHLVDSVGRNKKIKYFCGYNEQAVSYAAEGYSRFKNKISVCLVTTGPGSTNAVSGVASAWVDSIPVIFISGQVKQALIADYSKLRQIGEQEINIIDIVKPITKYAVTITRARDVRYQLEKAFYLAVSQRPGPVWLNIPLDIQASLVDEKKLPSFRPAGNAPSDKRVLSKKVSRIIKMLKDANRPVLVCGYGIRLGRAESLLKKLLKKVRVPVVLSFNGMDLIPETHSLLAGKPGIIGQRRANFSVQNSDCLLSIGSRLNLKIIGYNYRAFARRAKKIVVDIDKEELKKHTLSVDFPMVCDSKDFLREFLRQLKDANISAPQKWLASCRSWKKRYPSIIKDFFKDKNHVNTYIFYDRLSDLARASDPVISGNGLAALCLYQAFKVKNNQRVFTNNGYGAMGWGLPSAIGACIANNKRRTICVTGDGSIQMNIQELQFIKHHKLPIKIFIFNNYGYTSIRMTQDAFFNRRYIGSDKNSGISNPDFRKIASAYGLGYEKILHNRQLTGKIKKVLSARGPVLCEVNVSPHQGLSPKTTSYLKEDGSFASPSLEDMSPFLPRKELGENMKFSYER